MADLLELLGRWRLLKDRESARGLARPGEPPAVGLLRLCDAGLLEGGLAVAWGVRPDELVGALTHMMGGAARRFKVVDVRERPVLQLDILAGAVSERWEVEDVAALVHNLNALYREAADVWAIAVLGEWNDALQLLCVDKRTLPGLLREPFFAPRNRDALERPPARR
jgi:hypothetical protein